ncbi:phenylacetate--CoA ligase family protein [Methylotuvimicrobium sp.]|uniref:phenylacetate--CoA ligase family protein n=1 Tax=Methylotuvimicrobium sp. TaxID=2822413 RepID=UPI003D6603D1
MHPFISRNIVYPLQEKLLNRPTFSYLKELEKTQWLSREEIETLQLKKLRTLLKIANEHSPWHANRIEASGINLNELTLDDLRKIPTMTRIDAQQHGHEMVWHGVPGGAYRYTTGGSSGQPLIFYYGRQRQAADMASRIRARRWFGFNVGEPEVYLWGAPVELNKTDRIKTIRDRLLNQLLLNAFQMSPEKMTDYLKAIEKFQPRCMYGYASSLTLLCKHARQTGKTIQLPHLKVVCTTGEPLYPEQREIIAETFKVPVANEYGSRDAGFIAHENAHQQMLQMSESNIVEVLDAQGHPVKLGETGEVVITGLCSEAQPFIRYRTGDMASLSNETDKDGRGLHVVEQIHGRSTDFLVHEDGSIVHALAAIYILRETEGVEQFKIIQHDINEFEVLLVTNEDWHTASVSEITEKFKARFGNRCKTHISQTESILTESSGKLRQVVSKVQPDI